MQNTFETSRKYLLTLKERSGMSWAELSAATQLPDSTIRKIFSGDTSDPRLETISLTVTAMGGSLDDMLTGQPLQDSKPPDAESSVDPSDSQSEAALRRAYERRLFEVKMSSERYIRSLKRDKLLLFIISCTLTAILLLFLALDLALGSAGWIRYRPPSAPHYAFFSYSGHSLHKKQAQPIADHARTYSVFCI